MRLSRRAETWIVVLSAVGLVACGSRGGNPESSELADSTDATDAVNFTDGFTGSDGVDGTSALDATDGSDASDGTTSPDGTAITIKELQEGPQSAGCDGGAKFSPIKASVLLEGVVVTAGQYGAFTPDDPSLAIDGYFVAEGAGQNAGMQLAVPATLGLSLSVGDKVDVIGDYGEHYCMSQVSVTQVVVQGSSDVPEAAVVPPDDLVNPSTAEAWEGSLVKVENVEVLELAEFGEYVVTGGLVIGMHYKTQYYPNKGDKLSSITGVVEYAYKKYRLVPRSPGDIGDLDAAPASTTSISDLQSHESSETCTNEAGNLPPTQPNVSVTGIVVSPVDSVSANLRGFYLSAETPGPWSGLEVVFNKNDGLTEPALGDTVTLSGNIKEYYCHTQLDVDVITIDSSGEVPAPAAVESATLSGSEAESYESTYVVVSGVTVENIDALAEYKEFTVTGGLVINAGDFGTNFSPKVGDVLASVSGAVKYHFKVYKLFPFGDSYIVPE